MTDPSGRAVKADEGGGVGQQACDAIGWEWTIDLYTGTQHCEEPGTLHKVPQGADRSTATNTASPIPNQPPCLPELQVEVWIFGKRICVLNSFYLGKIGEFDPAFVKRLKECEVKKPVAIVLPNGTVVMASGDEEKKDQGEGAGEGRGTPPTTAPRPPRKVTHEGTIRVGRWMSMIEYEKMVKTGMVQEPNGGGGTYVLRKGPEGFRKQAPNGSFYVEFDVPADTAMSETNAGPGWWRIESPTSLGGRQAELKGLPIPQLPPATNITVVEVKP